MISHVTYTLAYFKC